MSAAHDFPAYESLHSSQLYAAADAAKEREDEGDELQLGILSRVGSHNSITLTTVSTYHLSIGDSTALSYDPFPSTGRQ